MKIQIYVSQPTESGCEMTYCVAKLNHQGTDYIPLKGEVYLTEEQAKERAAELNRDYEEGCK